MRCKDCGLARHCRDTTVSWLFFFIAIIAAIAIRLVNVLLSVSDNWAKVFWYIGVVGFAVYFLYKFNQDVKLKQYLSGLRIQEKLVSQRQLQPEDYRALAGLICSLRSKKETINYFIIFFTSAIAIALAVYQDFLRPLP